MEPPPRIWVDWNNGGERLIELYLPSTVEDLKRNHVEMKKGVRIRLYGDELECDAILVQEGRHWVADILPGTMVTVPIE